MELNKENGWRFTVVNTHANNPQTGDFTDLLGMGTMTAIGALSRL